jgi:hypothetical protein
VVEVEVVSLHLLFHLELEEVEVLVVLDNLQESAVRLLIQFLL